MYDPIKPYNKDIAEIIKKTWRTPYVLVKEDIVKKRFDLPEYHHSDGIGTKGIYHWRYKTLENAVTDAIAMNLNDMPFKRAIPYAIIDHLFLPEDNSEYILRIMNKLAGECKKRNIAITGGETAIHNDSQGIELSITMLGFIKNPKPNQFKIGDVLIGIKSSGIHSNGFTKIREVFGNKNKKEFTIPTLIYQGIISKIDEEYGINGMMHITGGAYTKLKKSLKEGDIKIDSRIINPHSIFYELYDKGISDEEMYKTFNCGIGFILSTSSDKADLILSEINNSGFKAGIVGIVTKGDKKIKIKSSFSDRIVEL
ncbi:MAG: AIR synthase-related protein [Candidatus Nanoarchaeia archaeon]|nr:AIR synthase-related protein [Candidatus Nanoarchaeia archaeon]